MVSGSDESSHRQYKHPTKLGRVTIADNLNDDLAHVTLNSILKQAVKETQKAEEGGVASAPFPHRH